MSCKGIRPPPTLSKRTVVARLRHRIAKRRRFLSPRSTRWIRSKAPPWAEILRQVCWQLLLPLAASVLKHKADDMVNWLFRPPMQSLRLRAAYAAEALA